MNNKERIREIMTTGIESVAAGTSVLEAAQRMSQANVGGLVVQDPDGTVCGFVTDRDITIRAIAKRLDPERTTVESICTEDPVCLQPTDTIENAVRTMEKFSVRRIPVVEDGIAVGIVSLGDLAVVRQPSSALGAISAAPAQE